MVFRRENTQYNISKNNVFWTAIDQKKDHNIVDMFLNLPIMAADHVVGHITHVEFDNKTLVLFYCLTRNMSGKHIIPRFEMEIQPFGNIVIQKIYITSCKESDDITEYIGELFDNIQTFILDREIY